MTSSNHYDENLLGAAQVATRAQLQVRFVLHLVIVVEEIKFMANLNFWLCRRDITLVWSKAVKGGAASHRPTPHYRS